MLNTFKIPAVSSDVRLSDYLGAWCMEEKACNALLSFAKQLDFGQHVSQHKEQAIQQNSKIQAKRGGDIAIVSLNGMLMKHSSSMTASTSTVRTRQLLRDIANDDSIAGVMLFIDSPGGTAAGTADLAAEIRRLNQIKPVHAYIEDLGASAAYWAASQADRITVNDKSADVGSIGTICGLYDFSGHAEKEGIEALVFATGNLKGTGFPGSKVTDKQRAYLQQHVESTQRGFDAAVMAGRGISQAELEKVRTGEVFPADKAMELKLIDAISSFDEAVMTLQEAIDKRSQKQEKNMSVDIEKLSQACPGADNDFLIDQLTKGNSEQQAAADWTNTLAARLQNRETEIAELKTSHTKAIEELGEKHSAEIAELKEQVSQLEQKNENIKAGVDSDEAPSHSVAPEAGEKKSLQDCISIK